MLRGDHLPAMRWALRWLLLLAGLLGSPPCGGERPQRRGGAPRGRPLRRREEGSNRETHRSAAAGDYGRYGVSLFGEN